ncbi:prominin-1-A-like [Ptychodera flava]|uniref:prominin-1-A-like n=1 Tax=Ptychodera flava TaxID=63121 RepID=UPI00396A0868
MTRMLLLWPLWTIVTVTLLPYEHGGRIEAATVNSVDSDGNIAWKDLPTPSAPYQSPAGYDEGPSPLPTLWKMMDQWIKLIAPGDIPYDVATDAFAGNFAITDLTGNFSQYIDILLGFGICIAIGVLFLLIFPIVCICFCACRTCCGKCGGKMYQKQSGNMCCKMVTFAILLTCVTAVIAGGCACAYFVNDRQASEFPNAGSNVLKSTDDIVSYVNNTANEVLFVAITQSNWTFDLIGSELNNVGVTVGVPVREALRPYIDPALNAILYMVDVIENTRDGLDSLNDLSATFNTSYIEFASSLSSLKQDIEELYSNCTTDGGCSADPQNTANTSVLVASRDFRDMSSAGTYPRVAVYAKAIALTAVIDNDLDTEAQKGRDEFEDIPELVQNETDAAVGDLTSSFGDFNSEIESGLDPMISNLNTLSSQATSFENTLTTYTSYVQDYDKYRGYFLLALCCMALLVVVLNLLGCFFGVLGYDGAATPTQRGGVSNCGGLMLMASVGFCCIFACLFMILTTLPFAVGGPLKKFVCDPIVSRELFTETIDQPDAIPGTDGYFLGNLLFQNGNISLTMTGILEDCEMNGAAYTSFKLENLINITEMLDVDKYISLDQFGNLKVNVSDQIEIMSAETESNLADARDANAADLPWTDYENELNSDLIDYGEDLDLWADALQSYITAYSGNSTIFPGDYQTQFVNMVTRIRNFQTSAVAPIISDRDAIKTLLVQVQNDSATIDLAVNNTILTGRAADQYIDDHLDNVVENEVENLQSRLLGYVDQFVAYVNDMIYNEVGKCLPVYNLIENLFNTLCRSILDAFNGLWFSMGWCVFFYIPSIVFGVKLAKYFRRMKEEDHFDDGIEMGQSSPQKSSAYQPYGKNKVDSI